MHLFFIDESGTPPKLGKTDPTYFVIGGLIVPEEVWHSIQSRLVGLKAAEKYHGEIKWRFFVPSNNDPDNPMISWSAEQRDKFRKNIFKIITDHRSVKLMACICNCTEAYKRAHINTQNDLYYQTYKPLTERFQYFLQDISRETGRKNFGMIVADQRNHKEDNKMRVLHERLVTEDSKLTTTYSNLIEGLFFSPSHLSVGIQFADMVAGAVWRKVERGDAQYYNSIETSFRSRSDGTIEGYGVISFPVKRDK